MKPEVRTVLFDLDGTLVDTAPDLSVALNTLLERHGQATRGLDEIRPHVSHGSPGMLRFAFGLGEGDPGFAELRREFLDLYAADLCRASALFPGMAEVLDELERRGLGWGVVTNKPEYLTRPLLDALDLTSRCACLVGGDTLPQRKPDPEPMHHAAALAGVLPEQCVYVGDAERDVEAGRRAGMRTLVALFGYLGTEDRPTDWGADALIDSPAGLLDWLDRHG